MLGNVKDNRIFRCYWQGSAENEIKVMDMIEIQLVTLIARSGLKAKFWM